MGGTVGIPSGDLNEHGITPHGTVYWNLEATDLVALAIERNEGMLSAHGALVTETGERTGRSPNDKYIVDEPSVSGDVNWGDVNVSTDAATFDRMRAKVVDFLSKQDALFVQDLYCGADFRKHSPSESSTTTLGTTPLLATCSFVPTKSNSPSTSRNSPSFTHRTSKPTPTKTVSTRSAS